MLHKVRTEPSQRSVCVRFVTLAVIVLLAGQGCAAVGLMLFSIGAGVAGGTGVSVVLRSRPGESGIVGTSSGGVDVDAVQNVLPGVSLEASHREPNDEQGME